MEESMLQLRMWTHFPRPPPDWDLTLANPRIAYLLQQADAVEQ